MRTHRILLGIATLMLAGGCMVGTAGANPPDDAGSASADGMVVQLCDGQTKTTVDKSAPKTRENGQKIAADLMAQWQRKHPEANWIAEERQKHSIVEPADNKGVIGRTQGQAYGQVTERDVLTWQRETLAMAVHGSTVFHSGDQLGSADRRLVRHVPPRRLQHPPRDVPEVPTAARARGAAPRHDQLVHRASRPRREARPRRPKMRALEAYIMAQRKGRL